MKLARNREAGQVFIMVLILLMLVPLLVVPMLRLSYSSQKSNQIVGISTLNTYAADAGIEYGRYQIYNFPTEIQEAPLDDDLVIGGTDVNVTVEYDAAGANYLIVSTATRAERSVTIESKIVIDVGLFGNVVACDGDLLLDHCDFENLEYPLESDIYTNGNVDLIQSLVDGDVNITGAYTDDGHSTVNGEVTEGVEAMEFPEIDAQIHEDRAKLGGTDPDGIDWKNMGNQTLGPLYIVGNLSIENTDVELQGTVYVTGTVSIKRTSFTGFGDLFSEGDFYMDNYSLNISETLVLPILMSLNGDIDLYRDNDGAQDTYAIVYAPSGDIYLDTVNLIGSVAATLVHLNNSSINYPADLRGRADLPGAGLDTVTYIYQ